MVRTLYDYRLGELRALTKENLILLIVSTKDEALKLLEEKYKKSLDNAIKGLVSSWEYKTSRNKIFD